MNKKMNMCLANSKDSSALDKRNMIYKIVGQKAARMQEGVTSGAARGRHEGYGSYQERWISSFKK